MVREAKEGLTIVMEAMNEGKLKALEEEDQREKKMYEMLETLEEMQRELVQIHPESLEMKMKKLQIHHDSLEMTKSEVEEMLEKTERDRERKKLQEPQKHGFFMDEETLRETYSADKMERSQIDRAGMLLRLKQMERQFLEKLNEAAVGALSLS